MSGPSERAIGRASGLVLQSVVLVILAHCGLVFGEEEGGGRLDLAIKMNLTDFKMNLPGEGIERGSRFPNPERESLYLIGTLYQSANWYSIKIESEKRPTTTFCMTIFYL